MRCGDSDSPACIDSILNVPYSSSLASSASASSASVWSDASSQHSDDTSVSSLSSDSDSCDSYCLSNSQRSSAAHDTKVVKHLTHVSPPLSQPAAQAEVPSEYRRNPRRTSISRSACPPALVRQSDRKVNFVDNLVDSSTQIVEAIWPTSSVPCRNQDGSSGVLPLRTFIQETLRRSRTSYSTLQVALYYLVLIKPHVPARDFTMEQPDDCHSSRALQCGRRMFLAALILASKYLQDRNYSARAWSKISGLNTQEINQNEMAFLLAVRWKLHITDDVYNRWTDCVMRYTPSQPPSPGNGGHQLRLFERQCDQFKCIILSLSPGLENIDDLASVASASSSPSRLSASRLAQSPESAVVSPRSLFSTPSREPLCGLGPFETAADLTPKPFGPAPAVMEPAAVFTPGRPAPAYGLLPTPRLTPQTGGFATPAVNCAPLSLGGSKTTSSMAMAMAQQIGASQYNLLDRCPAAVFSSSPQSYLPTTYTRRSSLANTLSTASSPESMVSDSSSTPSRTSRSSSVSSASSSLPVSSAPFIKLDVQARCRSAAKLMMCSEKFAGMGGSLTRPPFAIASVTEEYEENVMRNHDYQMSVSPELCGAASLGTAKEFCGDMSLSVTPTPFSVARRVVSPVGVSDGNGASDSVGDAARALQELHNTTYRPSPVAPGIALQQPYYQQPHLAAPKTGSKRSRAAFLDNLLQDNVRDMLAGSYGIGSSSSNESRSSSRCSSRSSVGWSDRLVRTPVGSSSAVLSRMQTPVSVPSYDDGRGKRLCCSSEAAAGMALEPTAAGLMAPAPSAVYAGFQQATGSGMWGSLLD